MNIITYVHRLFLLVLFAATPVAWAAEQVVPAAPQLAAKSWVLMDAASGSVLVDQIRPTSVCRPPA